MKRSETVRNAERSETFILYMMNGPKRLQNHVHGPVQKRKNYNVSLFNYYLFYA